LLSKHPGWDGTIDKVAAMKKAPAAGHPIVGGPAAVERSFEVLGECAQAQRDRFLIVP
jgi:metallo-beta-lactamase class B